MRFTQREKQRLRYIQPKAALAAHLGRDCIGEQWPTARVPHECAACQGDIAPKTQYRLLSFARGEVGFRYAFVTHRFCWRCLRRRLLRYAVSEVEMRVLRSVRVPS